MEHTMSQSFRKTIVAAFVCAVVGTAAASADEQRARQRSGSTTAPEASGWDLALTGGFVVSGLVDPVFALGNIPGQPLRVVVRTPDQESTVNLGLAMFGHVFNDRYSWVAPLSFGIGIRGDSRATFYLGSALRFGSHASVTAGAAVGSVAALPAGIVEGRTLTDTNSLINLGTRTTKSWFVGATYTFATLR